MNKTGSARAQCTHSGGQHSLVFLPSPYLHRPSSHSHLPAAQREAPYRLAQGLSLGFCPPRPPSLPSDDEKPLRVSLPVASLLEGPPGLCGQCHPGWVPACALGPGLVTAYCHHGGSEESTPHLASVSRHVMSPKGLGFLFTPHHPWWSSPTPGSLLGSGHPSHLCW